MNFIVPAIMQSSRELHANSEHERIQ